MNLIDLAKEDKLPKHQYMDIDTLAWIINNPIFGLDDCPVFNFKVELYEKYLPDEHWFVSAEEVDSIHGIRHLVRVMVFCEVIWQYLFNGDPAINIRNILIASALHDIARLDDTKDVYHGKRSAEWFEKNSNKVGSFLSVNFTAQDISDISKIIELHEPNYSDIKNCGDYISLGNEIDILKTADALDRYRMPKLKWRINENKLKIIPKIKLKLFAYSLVVESERNNLQNKSNGIESINLALKNIIYGIE